MKPEKVNAFMSKYLPELESDYAKYPMNRPKWLSPGDTGPNGEPCFLQETNTGVKRNYVFGSGPFGKGYYHLLTREAYKILYVRIHNEGAGCCCAFNADKRREFDEKDDLKRIMYNRSVAPVPSDVKGAAAAIQAAKQTSNAHYQFDQNIALAHNVVTNL